MAKAKRIRVEVIWVDACSDREGWQMRGDVRAQPKHQVIHTIGYLLERTKNYVHLAQSVDLELEMSAERITVPMGCVKKIVTLPLRTG